MAVIQLKPEFVERVWGSHALEPFYADSSGRKIGEVWLTHRPALPVLVKFLFTTEKLSVQVHPGGAKGKTEMWHILRAGPDSAVAVGFQDPVTREEVRAAAISGEIEGMLRWMPVRAGDTVFVPAGTVHAIGADVAICEIQQNNDVTYRLYDYGRGRELHLEEGLAVADLTSRPEVSRAALRLVACEFFTVDRLPAAELPTTVDRGIVVAIAGEGTIAGQPFRAGQAFWVEGESATDGATIGIEGNVDALSVPIP